MSKTGLEVGDELEKLIQCSRPFTRADLQAIREGMRGIGFVAGDRMNARLTVELIDAITILDVSTTKLMRVANRLTWAILGLTGIGVIFSVLQIVLRH
jgi:hypothetical protein